MRKRGRPKLGLNNMQVKAIIGIQEGKPVKVAVLDAGYPVDTDMKSVARRARKRLIDAALCEDARTAIRDAYPDLVLVGSYEATKLIKSTPAIRASANIDEGYRVFYEYLISQGWHRKDGRLVGPEDK